MAGIRGPAYVHFWEEDECLEYYGMFSLHQMFDVIGAHLTESDIDVLSFLLEETHPFTHPMNPELWAVEEGVQHDALVAAWERLNRRRSGPGQGRAASELLGPSICRPRNGVALLLELERRGKCDEGNFRHILQLLRVLTRHDLLHYVTLKRPRTVSPERFTYGPSVNYEQTVDSCLNSSNAQGDHCEEGSVSNKRVKAKRGRCGQAASKKRGRKARVAAKEEPTKTKVTCGILSKG